MKKGVVYISLDQKYSVSVSETIVEDLLRFTGSAGKNETGGILIGSYNDLHNRAFISCVTGPTVDSKSGRTWFYRGIKNLQTKINDLWKKKQYYLGEWHYHPDAPASPSFQDNDQMWSISRDRKYKCPEPILVIVGGSVSAYEIRIFVFPKGGTRVNLIERSETSSENNLNKEN